MIDFGQLKEDFLRWKEANNVAEATMKNYAWALNYLQTAYQATINKPIEDVSVEDVRILISWLYSKKVDKAKSRDGIQKAFCHTTT